MRRGVEWFVRLVLDRGAARRVESDIENSAERGGKRAESAFGKYAKRIAATLAAAFAIHRLVAFTKEVVNLGIEGAETANKFNTTFGEASGTVDRFVATWGRMAGASRDSGRELLSTTGAILQGLGYMEQQSADTAMQIARLAGDMTSFHNIPLEQTIGAINSALVGERERLKTLGIVLRETDVQERALLNTHKDSVDALTDQDKAAASLELIYERMGVAVGDLARTQDSQANVLRRVQGEWLGFRERLGEALVSGEALTPVLLQLSDAMSAMLDWVTKNQGALAAFTQTAVSALTTVGRHIGDFIAWLNPAEARIGQMTAARLAWIRAGEDEETQLARLTTARRLEQQNMIQIATAYNEAATRVEELKAELDENPLFNGKTRVALNKAEAELERLDGELKESTALLGAFAREATSMETALTEKIATPTRRAAEELAELNAQIDAALQRITEEGVPTAVTSVERTETEDRITRERVSILNPNEPSQFAQEFATQMNLVMETSRMASAIITDEFTEAFGRIAAENQNLGEAVGSVFGAMAKGALAYIDTLAKQKAQENLARAIEMTALGFGRIAVGDAAGAAASFKSAGDHAIAAAAWGALAAATPSGGAGGGTTGVGQPGRFDEPGGRFADAQQQTPTTIVYIDPNDPYNPVYQEVTYEAHRLGRERFGSGARIRVRPTREFEG